MRQVHRNILINSMLLFGALLFAVAIAEVTVRVVLPQNLELLPQGLLKLDPSKGYRLSENYRGEHKQAEYSIKINTNSLGLRDSEYGKKSAGKFRILVLGDSMTFGSGVAIADTWPKVLEKKLNKGSPQTEWEVINAAVPGYGPEHFKVYLKEICANYEPDYIIVGFLASHDIFRGIRHDYEIKGGRLYVKSRRLGFANAVVYPLNDFLRQRSHLYVLLKSRLRDIAARIWGTRLSGEFAFPESFLVSAQPSLLPTWQRAVNNLNEVNRLAYAISEARTYLVIIPSTQQALPERLKTELSVYNVSEKDVDVELPNRKTLAFCEANNIPVLADWAKTSTAILFLLRPWQIFCKNIAMPPSWGGKS